MNTADKVPYPDQKYSWYVVVILFLACTSSFIDRQIMALLVEPIKRDLAINDTQFSLLHGFAFAIFYTFMGLPLGRLAGRRNRKKVIAAGILFWSFLTRIGIGIGEAALSPAAYSMISDLFPLERRSRPVGLYSMGCFSAPVSHSSLAGKSSSSHRGLLTSSCPLSVPSGPGS